jgi:hypothetical protein
MLWDLSPQGDSESSSAALARRSLQLVLPELSYARNIPNLRGDKLRKIVYPLKISASVDLRTPVTDSRVIRDFLD